ncbi:hypothetical protein [Ectothiorhodospira sp. BSL-9]|uniref:hypothetical protein n=1 Tax=Ectothiorhodospira sp. BSL-9 TaxID=1442136 RepID=UPI0007B53307|nr:hypothetical protein [Ectothiorhodospira sp. BSL-9]
MAMALLPQRIAGRASSRGAHAGSREELPDYLAHRLRRVGCELPLFEPEAIEGLYQATHGMPRPVGRLAHYALTCAAQDQVHRVSADHLQTALEELRP